ncbi:MAG: hypothetical protein HYZ91_00090 [Candidatus Omnitrophica bacterium]|nr:hypothetical protein [Candidatus Omnitrophota bacterium]
MVGVCLTVIGLFRISDRLHHVSGIGDECLAIDALVFLAACLLAYVALRTRRRQRRYRVERVADWLFLSGLCLMAVVCALLVSELV